MGCAGFEAYVPDNDTGSGGTPLQCAALDLSTNTNPFVDAGTDGEETLQVINGQISGLHSRAPGDATVTLTVLNLPAGMAFQFEDGQTSQVVTVPLNNFRNVDIHYLPGGSMQSGDYQVTIQAQEAGCSPVVQTVTVTVNNPD